MVTETTTEKKRDRLNKLIGWFKRTLLNRIFLLFIFLSVVMVTIIFANQQNIISIPSSMMEYVVLAMEILMAYSLAYVTAQVTVNSIMNFFGDTFEPEQRILLSKIYVALLYTLATIFVFMELGVTSQNIAIFLGLIATGFAFAIRDIILSYIAWFILLTKTPFRIGDYISVEGVEGLVKHIGMFYVLIDDSPETYEDFYKVPNKLFLDKPIHNYGKNRFSNEFDIYLDKLIIDSKEILANPDEVLEKITDDIGKAVSARVILRLDSDHEGVKIRAYYKSTYKERDMVKDKVIRLVLKELNRRSKQQSEVKLG